jgi:Uma2 family endonuclease
MVAEPQLVTAHEFAKLPEQRAPIELIGGEIVVSPSPTVEHHDIVGVLREYLGSAARARGLGSWYQAPLDLFVTAYDVFQPDLMLFSPDQLPGKRELPIEKVPLIVIEVLSPGNRANDLIKKLPRYASRGIPEYWIVDPVQRSIWINLLDSDGKYQRLPVTDGPIQAGLYEGLILPLGDIFTS